MEINKPTIFAVYSVWGNQWLKLAMLMQNWCEDVNMLVSTDSILCGSKRRFETLTKFGINEGLLQTREEYREFIAKKTKDFPYLSEYLGEFEKPVQKIRSKFMLDSGGYGLTKIFEKGSVSSTLKTHMPNLEKHWETNNEEAQNDIIEKQAALQPDILITLDKVLSPSETCNEKKMKVEFNLKCAKLALAKKQEQKIGAAKLFAAVHGYGTPRLNDTEEYYNNTQEYMRSLLEFEDETGVKYDGFSIGSLVPISNEKTLQAIAGGVRDVLKRERRKTPIHGLGASSDKKIKTLYNCGVTIFDTNAHVRSARNRLIYDPHKKSYVSTRNINKNEWNCDCKICSNYPWEKITENRPEVREVSTVLISLHNLYSNHLEFIKTL